MSDLAATNCGGCGGCGDNCNSIVWIIILLTDVDATMVVEMVAIPSGL